MKTKKISWQAIAIVVLALVLIASIALGVSGAWFQDKDSESQDVQMGKPVLIKLADGDQLEGTYADVPTWKANYTNTKTRAFPGDIVLGATKIMAASDTATIYRAKIVTEVTGDNITEPLRSAVFGETPSFGQTQAETFKNAYDGDYVDWNKGTNPDADITTYTDDEIKYNLYLMKDMLSNLENEDWLKSDTDPDYIYYKGVSTAPELTLFTTDLKLSVDLTNACRNWEVKISVVVEAIQAANASLAGHPWNGKMPETLTNAITTYEAGRK